jgi:hypothetical protein
MLFEQWSDLPCSMHEILRLNLDIMDFFHTILNVYIVPVCTGST